MNRRLLLLITSPAMLLGLVLMIACIVSVVAINSSQSQLFTRINDKVASRHAAHEMEVAIHLLRFHSLVELIQPTPENRAQVLAAQKEFEDNLEHAKKFSTPGSAALLQTIAESYQRYHVELKTGKQNPRSSRKQIMEWIDQHPIQQVIIPCEELLEYNRKTVEDAFEESSRSTWTIQMFLFVLAIGGPLGGLCSGYFMARKISRSIARLQVRVQDVHSQLAPEESVVDLQMGSGIDELHDQLAVVVDRVQKLVERLHEHRREQVRSEQLVAAGQLASSIAHEIRNPLTAMKWLVDDAIQSYPNHPITLEDLQVLKGEIDRLKQSVQDMLDFVRPGKSVRTPGDLREVVRQAAELIRPRKRQLGVRSDFELPSLPVLVEFDPAQIKSVLVNLLLNALDAMPRGGVLGVRLTAPALPPADGRTEPAAGSTAASSTAAGSTAAGSTAETATATAAPPTVRLTIEDTGPGIAPDLLPNIFTPFVSTKATGTGLGLAVAKRLVEDHGGKITVENRPEGGARFVITLPALIAGGKKDQLCLTHDF
jgi:signal transduction histidine kinase